MSALANKSSDSSMNRRLRAVNSSRLACPASSVPMPIAERDNHVVLPQYVDVLVVPPKSIGKPRLSISFGIGSILESVPSPSVPVPRPTVVGRDGFLLPSNAGLFAQFSIGNILRSAENCNRLSFRSTSKHHIAQADPSPFVERCCTRHSKSRTWPSPIDERLGGDPTPGANHPDAPSV